MDDSSWPPKYWKLLLELDGGVKLAFCDSRRFARVGHMIGWCTRAWGWRSRHWEPSVQVGGADITRFCVVPYPLQAPPQHHPCPRVLNTICCAPPHPPPPCAQVQFLRDPEGQPPLNKLGWDPLLSMPTLAEFKGERGGQWPWRGQKAHESARVLEHSARCTAGVGTAVCRGMHGMFCLPALAAVSAL